MDKLNVAIADKMLAEIRRLAWECAVDDSEGGREEIAEAIEKVCKELRQHIIHYDAIADDDDAGVSPNSY